jgi:hypothetical protein
VLSLASAFQLMAQVLAELPNPVEHESLRARMAALHGREDVLFEPARFAKLLRQANDAEVADVRKTGDDAYEVSVHPTDIAVPRQRAAAKASPPAKPAAEAASKSSAAATKPDEASVTPAAPVRYRRGSRLGTQKPEIAMVGVVTVDDDHAVAARSTSPASGGGVKKSSKAAKPSVAPTVEPGKSAAPAKKKTTRKPLATKAD